MIIETKCSLNKEQQEFVDFVRSNEFPWFWHDKMFAHEERGMCFFTHVLRNRPLNEEPIWGITNSPYTQIAESIFWHCCYENNIKPKIVHRSGFNLTFYIGKELAPIHIDHEFPHKNFIFYLNDFSNAPTYILADDKKSVIYESKPEKHKALIFGGNYHQNGFCLPNERRLVLVVTFN